ncbi:MAG: lipid-A-disaccharide synthase [Desulfobulbaceae bacterium]|nr:lipid-A-disaccharide synthase [Desulfobulbaceae bacterium]
MSHLTIMIVAGEASGDLHGAHLVKALRDLEPKLSACGMGGEAMAGEGVEILYDAARMAVVGIVEVVSHIGDILAAQRILATRLREGGIDLLILIDYPDFNLMLAKKAKRLGIPILYYISPQVWAWRSGRVKTIRCLVDRMAVILPFEEEFYRRRGVKVDFVGHPLRDSVRATALPEEFRARHRIPAEATVVGLLPGSRKKEIASLLPDFLAAARLLAAQHPHLLFLLPLAPGLAMEDLNAHGLADCGLNIRVIGSDRYDLMASCDAVLAASGTVTLELAILDVPMVVAYRIAPLTYRLGRRLIKVEFMSLVNLVAGCQVVPELLQDQVTPANLALRLLPLISDPEAVSTMREGLARVRERLGGEGASRRAAQIALDLIGQR